MVAPEVEGNHKGCPYELPPLSLSLHSILT
jgi:hypothetical protein